MSNNPGVPIKINGVDHVLKFRPRGWRELERMLNVRPYASIVADFSMHVGMDLVLSGYYAGLIHDPRFRAMPRESMLDQIEKHIENSDIAELVPPLQKAMLMGVGISPEEIEKAEQITAEDNEVQNSGNAVGEV